VCSSLIARADRACGRGATESDGCCRRRSPDGSAATAPRSRVLSAHGPMPSRGGRPSRPAFRQGRAPHRTARRFLPRACAHVPGHAPRYPSAVHVHPLPGTTAPGGSGRDRMPVIDGRRLDPAPRTRPNNRERRRCRGQRASSSCTAMAPTMTISKAVMAMVVPRRMRPQRALERRPTSGSLA
jgi:hypothetical protein